MLTPEERAAFELVRVHFDEWWEEAQFQRYDETRDVAAMAFMAGVAAVAKPH
jgi:hypothetical protein